MWRVLAARVDAADLGGEFGHRCIASRSVLLQSTGEDVAQGAGIAKVRRGSEERGKNFGGAGARECRTTAGHFEEHCSEAEDIRPRVQLISTGLFGRHVSWGTHHATSLGCLEHRV